MSEEPTDQEAQDAAALARHLDGEEPTPEQEFNDLVELQLALDSLVKHHRKICGPRDGENPPLPSLAERVADLEAFIEEGMHE